MNLKDVTRCTEFKWKTKRVKNMRVFPWKTEFRFKETDDNYFEITMKYGDVLLNNYVNTYNPRNGT